jgi:hypothetical protein
MGLCKKQCEPRRGRGSNRFPKRQRSKAIRHANARISEDTECVVIKYKGYMT